MSTRRHVLAALFISAIIFLLYSGERMFLWIMALIAAVFILAVLNIAYTLYFMVIRQSMSPGELTAGESGTLVVSVSNRGLFPIAHVELWYDTFKTLAGGSPAGDAITDFAAYSFVSGIMPSGDRTIRQEIHFPYRGSYKPGVLKARLCDVFGLISYDLPLSMYENKPSILVLPRAYSPVVDSWGENPFTGGADIGKDEQEPYSVAEIRQYRPGDPLKRVHWKLTARTGILQVKEYDGVLSPRAAVFLDLSGHGLTGENASAFEDRMCQNAAALCAAALDSYTPLRLAVCSEESMSLSGALPQELIVFRRFLAGLRFDCPFNFCEVVRMEMDSHPEAGSILVVTALLTPELSDYLASLRSQGREVSTLVVPLEDGTEEYSELTPYAAAKEAKHA